MKSHNYYTMHNIPENKQWITLVGQAAFNDHITLGAFTLKYGQPFDTQGNQLSHQM